MRAIIFAVLALTVFATQSMAFSWVSDGGAKDTKAARVLAQSAVASAVTGTASETTLATYTLRGGTIGLNGTLRITPLFSFTNSANNKTFKVKLGSTAFSSITLTTFGGSMIPVHIRNRNSHVSQIGFAPFGQTGYGVISSNPTLAGTIDTSVDQTITITGQLANTGETITLEGYTIELLPGN